MPTTRSAAPIFAAVLLLLALYVGSYLALVVPRGRMNSTSRHDCHIYHYRVNSVKLAPRLFWPLEQADRKLRPDSWP
ncbi:hypothetical protein ETAA8_10390 [Anatilimnocola aggregata]|uniref:Uncharacterized protein n=1 Tax=Anatilimnocola aggregata TaxID=2528021 RepID=A0A517Y6V2_9BACT|nr:hypothetical protein [Anatilimnocola aggregata]QDU25967.1 hypothetical protein ETAA8_10390 [Anatilimnocola aggregata]